MITFFLCLYKTVRKVVTDLYATLSNDKSFLSSKRIERAILFNAALGMSVAYVWYRRASITTTEVVAISTMLFGYAGFNTIMGNKDKAIPAQTAEEKTEDKKPPTP